MPGSHHGVQLVCFGACVCEGGTLVLREKACGCFKLIDWLMVPAAALALKHSAGVS